MSLSGDGIQLNVRQAEYCQLFKRIDPVTVGLIATGVVLAILGIGLGSTGLFFQHSQLPQWLSHAVGTIGHQGAIASLAIGGGGVVLIAVGSIRTRLRPHPKASMVWNRCVWSLKQPFDFCLKLALPSFVPLDPWISCTQRVQKIAMNTLKVIAALLLAVPALALYSLSSFLSLVMGSPQINEAQLVEKPPAISLPTEAESYDIDSLRFWFNESCKDHPLKDSFEGMLDKVISRDANAAQAHYLDPRIFYGNLEAYLKYTAYLLKDMTPEERAPALDSLAVASSVCAPTWIEGTKKVIRKIKKEEEARIQLLSWLQELKEEIILDWGQTKLDLQWHSINYNRTLIGDEVGLDTSDLANDAYINGQTISIFSKNFLLWFFSTQYTPDKVIKSIKESINLQPFNAEYGDLMKDYLMLEYGYSEQEAADLYMSFYTFDENDNPSITENGVVLLLRSVGQFI